MKTAFLAFGTNLGDRLGHLNYAVRRLEESGVHVVAKSKIYASQSVEGGGEADFLNAVVRVETPLDTPELLALCQDIEVEAGRQRAQPGEHRGGIRALDIDLVLVGEEIWTAPELEIPHPRALRRNFVLQPLLDVLPGGWLEATELKW